MKKKRKINSFEVVLVHPGLCRAPFVEMAPRLKPHLTRLQIDGVQTNQFKQKAL